MTQCNVIPSKRRDITIDTQRARFQNVNTSILNIPFSNALNVGNTRARLRELIHFKFLVWKILQNNSADRN